MAADKDSAASDTPPKEAKSIKTKDVPVTKKQPVSVDVAQPQAKVEPVAAVKDTAPSDTPPQEASSTKDALVTKNPPKCLRNIIFVASEVGRRCASTDCAEG